MSSGIALIDPSLIDSNRWYALFIAGPERRNQTLGCIYGQGTKSGAITMDPEAPSLPKQRWQIYPLNATTYVLRNQRGGANAFLGAFFEPKETADGQTRPRIVRGDIADATVYWSFGRWGDGTYWLSNAANTTDWHYDVSKTNAMKMSRDIAPPQADQRWNFEAVAVIDDSTYSTVDLLGATVTTPNTASSSLPFSTPTSLPPSSSSSSSDPSNTTTSSSSSGSSSSSSSGLSTGAKAGIGAGIGGAVLIALVVLGLFLFRRRKQRSTAMHDKAVEPYKPVATTPDTTMTGTTVHAPPPHQDPQAFGRHEMYNDSEAAKYEMPAPPRVEVQGRESPAELPGTPLGRGR